MGSEMCIRDRIDASPDIRQQLLRENVDTLDGVLFTHPHADHIHGVDDLRAFWIMGRGRLVDTYANEQTAAHLHKAFGYCYETPDGSSYPPILNDHRIVPYEPVTIDGAGGPITALPYEQTHGDIVSLGFRIENFAYSSDVSALSDQAFDTLDGVDAVSYTHLTLPTTPYV